MVTPVDVLVDVGGVLVVGELVEDGLLLEGELHGDEELGGLLAEEGVPRGDQMIDLGDSEAIYATIGKGLDDHPFQRRGGNRVGIGRLDSGTMRATWMKDLLSLR